MASLYRTAHCLRSKATTSAVFSKFYSTKKSINLATSPARRAAAAVVGLSSFSATGGRTSATNNTGYASLYSLDMNPTTCQSSNQHHFRNFSSLQMPLQSQPNKLVHHNAMLPQKDRRFISSKEITKNMTLYTSKPFQGEMDAKTLQFMKPSGNPLVLIMSWLMAKQKHLRKYAEIYTELGFDVAVVHITPWQLLWPVKGTQIVAAETLKFLENNRSYAPIIVHGFSVGAYQFGEIMLQMANDMARYAQVIDRFACQIWDSAADITEIPVGLPKSIFPKNPRMQSALRNYTLYHLKTFHNQATIHYMRSSQMFHSTLIKVPALFFVADNDPIGPPASNNAVRENWERASIKVTYKRWERSLHAAHMIKHRDEYLEFLFKHLESNGVLEGLAIKSRAKL